MGAAVATAVCTVGEPRYSFAYTLAATLFVVMECGDRVGLAAEGFFPAERRIRVGLVALVFLFGANWDTGLVQVKQWIVELFAPRPDWAVSERRLKQMQAAVPEGAAILVHLATPFLLDYTRNIIYVCDLPGGVSPPPGLPVNGNREEIAGYLRARKIRYVAYSYANEAGFSYKDLADRLDMTNSTWREQARLMFAFHRQLERMGQTYKRIFDDGDTYVIDLDAKKPCISPGP